MLQLAKLKENNNDGLLTQTFVLTFKDENLPEEAWNMIKNNLKTYKYQLNSAEIQAETNIRQNHVNLIITIPQIKIENINDEIDNTLEELKIDFQEYYKNLTARVHLIPVLALQKNLNYSQINDHGRYLIPPPKKIISRP